MTDAEYLEHARKRALPWLDIGRPHGAIATLMLDLRERLGMETRLDTLRILLGYGPIDEDVAKGIIEVVAKPDQSITDEALR